MAIQNTILSIVASEERFLASILSAEAVKTSVTALWVNSLNLPSLLSGLPNQIISKAVIMEGSIANVIDAAADKEIAIAAKVSAVTGQQVNIIWTTK